MSRLPPDLLAAHWIPGSGPVRVLPLSAGWVNASYRVQRDGRWYALRDTAGGAPLLPFDRGWECRVLRLAAAAGLAPRLHHCDPQAGVLVADWAGAAAWGAEDVRSPRAIRNMAELLQRVHRLPPPEPAVAAGPRLWIERYGRALAERGRRTTDFAAAAGAKLERLDADPAPAVLCHGDLHRENVVGGSRPLLIDWEYAHVAEPLWDVAGWVANNDGDAQFSARVLAAYAGPAAAAACADRLGLLLWLYDYVCLLWSRLYLTQENAPHAAGVAARAALLAERLASGGGRAAQLPAH